MDDDLPPGDTFGYLIGGGELGARLALLPIPATDLFSPTIPAFNGNAFSQLNGANPTAPINFTWDGYTPLPEINDSPLTAPSKRVESLVAGYEKPLLGALAVLGIGLNAIRRECPHFNEWLSLLERLPQQP